MMLYLELIWVFFQIGILSFGGGYAVLPMIEQMVVQERGWMSAQQYIDVLTISEMTPGPIAINAATFVGNQLLGLGGGVAATLGVVLPSLIIVLILAYVYFKYRELEIVSGVVAGMRPAVVALIASAGLTIVLTAFFGVTDFPVQLSQLNIVSVIIFGLSLFALRKFKMDPIKIIVLSGLTGLIVYSILG